MLLTFRNSVTESSRLWSPRRTRAFLAFCAMVGSLCFGSASDARADELPGNEMGDGAPPALSDGDVADRVTEVDVSPAEALPGGTVHVDGICTLRGRPATDVFLFFFPVDSTTESTSVSVPFDLTTGRIEADIRVPPEARPGAYELYWMCGADDMAFGGNEEGIRFTVLGPGPATTEPTESPADVTEPAREQASAESKTERAASGDLAPTGFAEIAPTVAVASIFAAAGTAILVRRRIDTRQGR